MQTKSKLEDERLGPTAVAFLELGSSLRQFVSEVRACQKLAAAGDGCFLTLLHFLR